MSSQYQLKLAQLPAVQMHVTSVGSSKLAAPSAELKPARLLHAAGLERVQLSSLLPEHCTHNLLSQLPQKSYMQVLRLLTGQTGDRQTANWIHCRLGKLLTGQTADWTN